MARGNWKRRWIKLHVTGWLHGSIRWQLDPAERGVFADLLALAGECAQEGKICDNDGRSYPLPFMANQLNIELELLERTLEKCRQEGRIQDNGSGVLEVKNFSTYQSEYERQKAYRETGGEAVEDEGKMAKDKKPEFVPLRKLIFEGLKEKRQYNSPNPAREAAAMTWMLGQGYSAQQILQVYDQMKADPFWAEKHLDMQSVKKQIGAKIKNGTHKQDPKSKTPIQDSLDQPLR